MSMNASSRRALVSLGLLVSAALVGPSGCAGDPGDPGDQGAPDPDAGAEGESEPSTSENALERGREDLDMKAEDFQCILTWDKVRMFRITNLLGHTEEALAIARANEGGEYPVGTIIQLIPSEAMVKRGKGFSRASNDWEFFSLQNTPSGSTIRARGGDASVKNSVGGSCLECHSMAAPQWDMTCEKTHGCDPLPFTDEQIM